MRSWFQVLARYLAADERSLIYGVFALGASLTALTLYHLWGKDAAAAFHHAIA
jgi:hypothetical protein